MCDPGILQKYHQAFLWVHFYITFSLNFVLVLKWLEFVMVYNFSQALSLLEYSP
jgi:hypothetical protein